MRRFILPFVILCCLHSAAQAVSPASVVLQDKGGGKMGAHRVHVIWWNAKPFTTSYQRSVHSLFQDVARDSGKRSNVYSVLSEYKIPYQVQWAGSSSGSVAVPPKLCPSYIKTLCAERTQLNDLIKQQMIRRNWQAGFEDLYMVMMPRGMNVCMQALAGNICSGDYWAGVHGVNWESGKPIIWGLIAYDSFFNGVNSSTSYDQGVATILFHEHLEAITDPLGGSGWIAKGWQEIADLCEGKPWQRQKIGMHTYTVPAMWSNRLKRCVYRA